MLVGNYSRLGKVVYTLTGRSDIGDLKLILAVNDTWFIMMSRSAHLPRQPFLIQVIRFKVVHYSRAVLTLPEVLLFLFFVVAQSIRATNST